MKKVLVLSLLCVFAFGSYVSARTVYDSTGRHIIQDDTLRAQKKARAEKRIQAAAAAKINYEDNAVEEKKEETMKPLFKSNYYQDRNK